MNDNLRLVFSNTKTAPIALSPGDAVASPRGRVARLETAIKESLSVALARMREWQQMVAAEQEQEDGAGPQRVQPIVLVCAADAGLGGRLLDTVRPGLRPLVCGPVVMLLAPAELARILGGDAQAFLGEIGSLGAQPGDLVWAFAVNGSLLDLRVMRSERVAPPVPLAHAQPRPNPADGEAPAITVEATP